jgi:hypothetical protein
MAQTMNRMAGRTADDFIFFLRKLRAPAQGLV